MTERFSFRDFLFQYGIRSLALGVPLHEYCHLVVLRILGGEGLIVSWALNQMQYEQYTRSQLILTAYSGGILSGIVWLLLSFHDRDIENRLVSRVIAVSQIVYGIFEGTAFALNTFLLIRLGDLISGILIFGLVVGFVIRSGFRSE